MFEPLISLTILDFKNRFSPGEKLGWEFQIDAVENSKVAAVENSLLWYTMGKGDEDIGVHYFERRIPKKNTYVDLTTLRRYESELPNSPLSYDGFLLKINWCVRVRVFLKGGKEISEEIPFELVSPPIEKKQTAHSDLSQSKLRVVGI